MHSGLKLIHCGQGIGESLNLPRFAYRRPRFLLHLGPALVSRSFCAFFSTLRRLHRLVEGRCSETSTAHQCDDSMGDEPLVVAKWDYEAQQEQELNIRRHETLWLLDDSKSWWRVRNLSNETGFVPSNFVERKNNVRKGSFVKQLKDTLGIGKGRSKSGPREGVMGHLNDSEGPIYEGPMLRGGLSSADGGMGNAAAAGVGGPVPGNGVHGPLPTVYVKFGYNAERDDELTLVKGASVTVLEKCSDGWWKGQLDGCVGWFPSNYVVPDEVPSGGGEADILASLAQCSEAAGATKTLPCVQALYPYNSGNPEELRFARGETMEVLEKPENDPEWWRCRKTDGSTGLVPRNYVQELGLGVGPGPQWDPAGSAANGVGSSGMAASVLWSRPWYHGRMSRQQAEALLNERGQDGDFIVRDSESSPNDFSISLKASRKNKHFKVQSQDGIFFIGQRQFASLDTLVEHYKKAPIFTNDAGDKLYLVKPLQ
uniref:NCK adaptor protein 2 n=1 Tax=Eptatretus burgeri TaxID=7764 RepID=A0A8C4QTX9_EPTBU